ATTVELVAGGGDQPGGADAKKRLSFAGATDCTPAGVTTSTLAIVVPDFQPRPVPGFKGIDAFTTVSTSRPAQPTTVTGTVTTASGRSRLQPATTLATGWYACKIDRVTSSEVAASRSCRSISAAHSKLEG